MKTIGIGLRKGGVGKTTIATTLAARLSQVGKTLLIDGDPQGNSTCVFLKSIDKEFADVLYDRCKLNEAIEKTGIENLYILPSNPLSNELHNYKVSSKVNDDWFLLDDLLKSVNEFFDYVVIDTSPDFSTFEKNLFFACDEIIPVVNADTFATDGLLTFVRHIDEFKKQRRKTNLEMKTLVINKFNASMSADSKLKDSFEKIEMFKTKIVIPQDQDFKVSQLEQRVVNGKEQTRTAINRLFLEVVG